MFPLEMTGTSIFLWGCSEPSRISPLLWNSSYILRIIYWETETEMEHHMWYYATYIRSHYSYCLAHDGYNELLFSILSVAQSAKYCICVSQSLAQQSTVIQHTKEMLYQPTSLVIKERRLCLYRVVSTATRYTLPFQKKKSIDLRILKDYVGEGQNPLL